MKITSIPEMIFNIPENEHNNNSIILRYLKNNNKALDFYISNAYGVQDLGQLIKSEIINMVLELIYFSKFLY